MKDTLLFRAITFSRTSYFITAEKETDVILSVSLFTSLGTVLGPLGWSVGRGSSP